MLVFLQALLASQKRRAEQEVTALLREAAELHFSGMQGLPLGPEYFEKLDPLFLVCIAREYLFFCPKQVRGRRTFLAGVWTGWDRGRDLPGQSAACTGSTQVTWGRASAGTDAVVGALHLEQAPGDASAAGLVRGPCLEEQGPSPGPGLYPRELGSFFQKSSKKYVSLDLLVLLSQPVEIPCGQVSYLTRLIYPHASS